MTTSAARILNNGGRPAARHPSGMTLLELVIAMSLIVVILGLGVVHFVADSGEREIRQAVSKVEAMASRGHAMAILHQKPFWLRLEPGRIVLAGAEIEERRGEDDLFMEDLEWAGEEVSNEVIYDSFSTDTVIGLRRWGAKEDAWIFPKETPTGMITVSWNFQSSGLCEPVAFRVERDESWVEMQMHPLTARIEEEAMEIR